MPEQLDKRTGYEASATDLTWSYATVLKAIHARASLSALFTAHADGSPSMAHGPFAAARQTPHDTTAPHAGRPVAAFIAPAALVGVVLIVAAALAVVRWRTGGRQGYTQVA